MTPQPRYFNIKKVLKKKTKIKTINTMSIKINFIIFHADSKNSGKFTYTSISKMILPRKIDEKTILAFYPTVHHTNQ